jgi:hypothetical protein
MAITRTQIAKQLLAQGGRTGFQGGGADAGTRSFAESQGRSRAEVDQLGRDFGFSGTDVAGDSGRQRPDPVITPPPKPPITKDNFKKPNKFVTPAMTVLNFLGNKISGSKLAMLNNKLQRNNYLATLTPEEQVEALEDLSAIGIGTDNPMGIDRNIERGMGDRGFLGTGIGGGEFITDPDFGGPEAKAVLGQGYTDYQNEQRDRFTSKGGEGIQDPCRGPNPPAYCFTGLRSAEAATPEVEEDDEIINYRLMNKGGMTNDAPVYEGGIMDLESSRQMYGLGKLVKKVTRSVKKIAKSPIGKAALLYAGGTYLGGLNAFGGSGTFISNLKSGQGIGNLFNFGKNKLFGELITGGPKEKGFGYIKKGLLNNKALLGIAAPTIASYFMTPEEEEEQKLYAGADIDDVNTIINNPYKYMNPRLMAEGGSTEEKEPVAKKVMPLLDMEGQEKDYRETGGFVDMGRMEKADDVPARLSKNEFVFTADAVRNAGDGSVDKGAEVMYNMMKNLESGGDVSEESQGLEGARKMFQTSQRLEEVL